jgi:hypothetical protein
MKRRRRTVRRLRQTRAATVVALLSRPDTNADHLRLALIDWYLGIAKSRRT